MKKGLIAVICAAIIIGVAFVAYDKMATKTANAATINNESESNTSKIVNNDSTAKGSKQLSKSDAKNTTNAVANVDSTSNQATQATQSNNTSTNKINTAATENSNSSNENQNSTKIAKNNSNSTKLVVFGDIIPGTNEISRNIILKGGVVYPKSANGFFMVNSENKEPIVDGNITVSASTPYSEYSGYSSLFKYYIISPYKLNDGPYKTTQNLNANNPADTNFNETSNNLTAIAYMQGGVIVAINSSGQTVYVSAKSVKEPITFERGNLQYFEANAKINTDNVVPVRGEPGELPTFDTIGNKITQKGLNVVAIAQVNNFTKIIFGTDRGIFSGWVPSSDLTIENYS